MRSLVRVALVLIGLGGVATACTVQARVLMSDSDDPDVVSTPIGWTFWVVYAGVIAAVVGVAVGKGTGRPRMPDKPRRGPRDRPG